MPSPFVHRIVVQSKLITTLFKVEEASVACTGQLTQMSRRLYEGQLANIEDVETFHGRILSAENNIESLRELTVELSNCIKCKNTKVQHFLAKNSGRRDKYYQVIIYIFHIQ